MACGCGRRNCRCGKTKCGICWDHLTQAEEDPPHDCRVYLEPSQHVPAEDWKQHYHFKKLLEIEPERYELVYRDIHGRIQWLKWKTPKLVEYLQKAEI